MKNTLKIEESLLQYLSAEEEAALHRLYLAEEHFLKTRTDNRNFSIAVTKHFSGDMQENTLVYVVNPEKKYPNPINAAAFMELMQKHRRFVWPNRILKIGTEECFFIWENSRLTALILMVAAFLQNS